MWAWLETGVMASPSWTKHPSDLGARSARSSEGFRPEPHHTWSPEKLGGQSTREKSRARGQNRAGPRSRVCERGDGRSCVGSPFPALGSSDRDSLSSLASGPRRHEAPADP